MEILWVESSSLKGSGVQQSWNISSILFYFQVYLGSTTKAGDTWSHRWHRKLQVTSWLGDYFKIQLSLVIKPVHIMFKLCFSTASSGQLSQMVHSLKKKNTQEGTIFKKVEIYFIKAKPCNILFSFLQKCIMRASSVFYLKVGAR